jgi:hypothetical protein
MTVLKLEVEPPDATATLPTNQMQQRCWLVDPILDHWYSVLTGCPWTLDSSSFLFMVPEALGDSFVEVSEVMVLIDVQWIRDPNQTRISELERGIKVKLVRRRY